MSGSDCLRRGRLLPDCLPATITPACLFARLKWSNAAAGNKSSMAFDHEPTISTELMLGDEWDLPPTQPVADGFMRPLFLDCVGLVGDFSVLLVFLFVAWDMARMPRPWG